MHQDTISGTIDRFLYQNHENGFAVFILQTRSNNPVTVTGFLPNLQAGQEVQISGAWIYHAKFGKQFEAKECVSMMPTTVVGLKKYLGSGLIKGIGPKYAEKLVTAFGTDILSIIDNEPHKLSQVPGIGQKRIEIIIKAWNDQKEIANLMVYLQERDITPSMAAKIYKQYKHESIAILNQNPYRLADDIWGVGFRSADEIAQKIGFSKHAPERIAAAIQFIITTQSQQGHLYVELQDLKNKTVELLELEPETQAELLKNALHTLYNAEKIKLVTHLEKHYITLSSFYFTEKNVCKKINTILQTPSPFNFNIDVIYGTLRAPKPYEIQLNDDQQRGILSCLQHKITIITGGPGTGKTTLIKKLLSTLDGERVSYKLAAPTGRAAKRIIEGTGKFAATIHRLLEFDASTMGFVHNESNALKVDFLIIDEASMIDIFLINSILKAMPLNAHLVLIGDIDQLPSVGPGNVLNDLIASEKIACVRLTQIFRQAQDSLIVVNAHKINKGEFPITFQENGKRDFFLIKEEEQEKVVDHLKKILFIDLPKIGISHDDAIILTPMNRGIIGTISLNHTLQQLLNPEFTTQSYTFSGTTYKIKDKVMQIRNNYDKQVYNGDIGVIAQIDTEERELTVLFDQREVVYEFEEINELVLAYAISIHKSQGSEYAAVIIPLFMSHFMLLQKNLVYTGLTRAKRICYFIGQTKAIGMAIRNNKGTKRQTFLKEFLIDENFQAT